MLFRLWLYNTDVSARCASCVPRVVLKALPGDTGVVLKALPEHIEGEQCSVVSDSTTRSRFCARSGGISGHEW